MALEYLPGGQRVHARSAVLVHSALKKLPGGHWLHSGGLAVFPVEFDETETHNVVASSK